MSKRMTPSAEIMSTCTFDTSYKDTKATLREWRNKHKYSDELKTPLIELEIELAEKAFAEVQHVPQENAERLFKACEYLGIPRVWIGDRELVGADEVKQEGTWQPSIWMLKTILNGDSHTDYGVGFAAGCGNTDQSQTQNTEQFIPEEYINKAWDVATRTEIKDITPFQKRMVVSDGFRKLTIPPQD